MAKYERYFPELKKQLTESEDRLATLMQFTGWDLQQEETMKMFREAYAELKKMMIKEWKNGWNSKTRAVYEAGKEDGRKEAKKQGMAAAEPQPALTQWEYWCGCYDNTMPIVMWETEAEGLEEFLNNKGAEGWELMSIGDTRCNYISLVFKRMKIKKV